ncbi:MAG: hypothetical protein RL701_6572 [Pseudomonadota bacterium]
MTPRRAGLFQKTHARERGSQVADAVGSTQAPQPRRLVRATIPFAALQT